MGLVGNRGTMMAHEATDESQLSELTGMKRYHPPITTRARTGSSAIRPTFVELRQAVEGHAVVHLVLEPGRPVQLDDAWITAGQLITTNDPNVIPQATLDRATLIFASRKHAPSWAAERGPLVELGDVLRGEHPGRASDDEIIVFISAPALGFVDVATAWWCFQTAKARGLGIEVPLVDTTPVESASGL
jgi:ornithine cyclodeaminase/alanine dehydrogenase-like protein (mu-crystallin family)